MAKTNGKLEVNIVAELPEPKYDGDTLAHAAAAKVSPGNITKIDKLGQLTRVWLKKGPKKFIVILALK